MLARGGCHLAASSTPPTIRPCRGGEPLPTTLCRRGVPPQPASASTAASAARRQAWFLPRRLGMRRPLTGRPAVPAAAPRRRGAPVRWPAGDLVTSDETSFCPLAPSLPLPPRRPRRLLLA